MSKITRALVAIISSLALLFASSIPSVLTAQASAAVSAYGETYATLGAFSGLAGPVAVSGGGYEPGTQVAVFVGDGAVPADAPKATVDANNAFGPVVVNVPVGTPQGAVTITASGVGGLTDGLLATNSYYVTPFTASLSVTAAAHTPGSPVLVSGSGYAPGETVNLALATATSSVVADASGAFTGASITVPKVAASSYTLTGTGAASGASAVDYFYIDAFYPSAYPSAYYLLPGQTLSFSGNGYEPGETVDVGQTLAPTLSSFEVPASATFEEVGGFTIPLDWANSSRELNLIGRSSGGTSVLTVSIGAFFPGVTPSDYYAMPGKSVTFNGNSFANGEVVDLFVGAGTTPVATVTADETGAFEEGLAYTIPFGTKSSVDFRFVGQSSKAETTTSVSVGALYPQIQPSEYYIRPGSPLTVTGSGFAAGETVSLAATGIAADAVADEDGLVEFAPVTIPFGATESLELTATGATSTGVATVAITIGAFNATASASEYYLLPGNPLTITGAGFAPGEEVELHQGLVTLATVTADEDGAVTNEPVVVPFGAAGPVEYSLHGVSSLAVATVTITAGEYFATVSSSNYYVQPGTAFTVTGSGFAPNEDVTVVLGGTTVTTTTDEDGVTPEVPLVMPYLSGEDTALPVTLTGAKSETVAETSITAAPFYGNVSPSTWYDTSGKAVTFTGTGFANGESVAVTLNEEAVGSVLVGTDGTFEFSGVSLPFGVDSANFSFVGSLSHTTANISVGLAPYSPSVTPSTWYGTPGSNVTFEGTSFAPGETVTATSGTTVVGTATADEDGAFTLDGGALPFTGPATYSFVGSLTAKAVSVDVGIAGFNPGVQLSAYYGPGGTDVVVTGSGFAPGESVAVSFGSKSLGSVTADTDGAFSIRTTAPFAPAGDVAVTATGASSAATVSTSFTYAQVYNSVELASYGIAPGEAVQFIGSGYLPGEPVEVRVGGAVVHTFNASATGAVSDNGYLIPADQAPGELTLTVRGTQSFTEHDITIYVTGG